MMAGRFGLVLLAGLALWIAAPACADEAPAVAKAPTRPNILLILADDMGYSDIGAFGGEIHTPQLDRLAAEGVRFTQFYNCARCCPTRAALLTGLYPQQAGVGDMMQDDGIDGYRGELAAHAVTIAEVLRGAGYRTAITGKWHVTRQLGLWYGLAEYTSQHNWPLQRGFDFFYGTIHACGSYFDPVTLCSGNQAIAPQGEDYYYTDAIASAATRFLGGLEGEEPFFLYVPFTAPHWPLHARPEDIERYRGRYDEGFDALREQRFARMREIGLLDERSVLTPRDPRRRPIDEDRDPRWQARRMEVYAAQIDRMDQAIGRILDAVRAAGRLDDTLVVFLADNGGSDEEVGGNWGGLHIPRVTRDGRRVRVGNDPRVEPGAADTYQSYGVAWANASNTPFRRYKGFVHEGGIATPLIAWWKNGVVDAGRWSPAIGHVVDLMATCVDLAGARYPTERHGQAILPLEGRSLRPLLEGRTPAPREALCWEHEGNRAVRMGRFKLVARHGAAWELYDMEVDRSELTDLGAQDPERVAAMAATYAAWARRVGVVPWDDILRRRGR